MGQSVLDKPERVFHCECCGKSYKTHYYVQVGFRRYLAFCPKCIKEIILQEGDDTDVRKEGCR